MVQPVRLTYSVADQSFAQTKSLGILRLSLDLLRQLAPLPEVAQLGVFSNHTLTPGLALPASALVQDHNAAVAGRCGRIWWDQSGVYSAARRMGHDWLLLPKGFASGLKTCPVKLATYVHDVMPDYYWQHHRGGVSRLENAYFRWALRCSLRYSKVILTNSAFTAAEVARIAREGGLKAPPIHPVGIGFTARRTAAGGPRDSIMVLASPLPHKRTGLVLEYLARWQTESQFPGRVHWVGRLPAGLPKASFANWMFHSRMGDEAYERLQSEARALVYVSDYEGFGMPPVEAVLAGACPVYSDIAATREVMAGAGQAFENDSYGSFAKALTAALKAPAGQLQQWANDLLRRHQWASVTARVLEALAQADARTVRPAGS